MSNYLRKPDWLKIKLPNAREYSQMKMYLSKYKLHTICESGSCPNIGECWNAGTATFMILGNICTRSCKFCNVLTGKPSKPDENEPENIANAVNEMGIKHCVLTSVDRDDLQDGGANHWNKTIQSIKKTSPGTTIEALIPDFSGNSALLEILISAKPEILSHNLETVRRLTPEVRSAAKYERSLNVLKIISDSEVRSKSGIMLGLGENEDEIFEVMDDLLHVGCKILTLGQYLQPTMNHLPVSKYVKPEEFDKYKQIGLEKGFLCVESGPLIRSSYHAEKHI